MLTTNDTFIFCFLLEQEAPNAKPTQAQKNCNVACRQDNFFVSKRLKLFGWQNCNKVVHRGAEIALWVTDHLLHVFVPCGSARLLLYTWHAFYTHLLWADKQRGSVINKTAELEIPAGMFALNETTHCVTKLCRIAELATWKTTVVCCHVYTKVIVLLNTCSLLTPKTCQPHSPATSNPCILLLKPTNWNWCKQLPDAWCPNVSYLCKETHQSWNEKMEQVWFPVVLKRKCYGSVAERNGATVTTALRLNPNRSKCGFRLCLNTTFHPWNLLFDWQMIYCWFQWMSDVQLSTVGWCWKMHASSTMVCCRTML